MRLRWRLSVLALSLVCLAAARLYLTWLVKVWSEELLDGGSERLFSLMSEAVLVTIVVVAAVFASQYLMSSVNQRFVEALRDAVQRRLLTLSMTSLRRLRSGDLMSRVFNDVGALSGFVRDVIKRLLGEGLVLVGAVVMIFYLEWRLALATCVMVPVVVLVLGPLGRSIRRTAAVAQRRLGGLAAILQEQLRGVTTIKGFQTEAFEQDRFVRANADYRRQAMRNEWWSSVLLTTVWLITGVGLLIVLWYGSRQVLDGRISAGGLLAFCLYAVQTIEPLRHLGEVQSILQRGLAAAARVYEIIDCPEVETTGVINLPACGTGDLQFERVRFRYSEDERVLEGIDLTVGAGEAVAVVGASGAGKSTLAKLLVRFDDPQQGRILLDGVDLRALRLADLRRAVCVVEQDPFIFSGPLVDNVRYGSWQAPYAAIDSAVDLAGLEPFVRSLPGGLQALLDEGGGNLSGGQKQRIALARAIVRDPAVLVLDEATSAIDSDTERQIFAQLENWLARRTVLVMAHRLSTVNRFGRVIVLAAGCVVGDASVPELRRRCPVFRELFAEQLALAGEPRRAAGLAV